MTDGLRLTGYHFGVCTRSVRMGLAAKGLTHDFDEGDPFEEGTEALTGLQAFARTPVLEAGALRRIGAGTMAPVADVGLF